MKEAASSCKFGRKYEQILQRMLILRASLQHMTNIRMDTHEMRQSLICHSPRARSSADVTGVWMRHKSKKETPSCFRLNRMASG